MASRCLAEAWSTDCSRWWRVRPWAEKLFRTITFRYLRCVFHFTSAILHSRAQGLSKASMGVCMAYRCLVKHGGLQKSMVASAALGKMFVLLVFHDIYALYDTKCSYLHCSAQRI
jgi:hypothetical protein